MAITRSPGPIPRMGFPPNAQEIAAQNLFNSRLAAGLVAQNAASIVEAIGLASFGSTTGDSGSYSGTVALAGSQNVTVSLSSGSNRAVTAVVVGPSLLSIGISNTGNTAGTSGLVATRYVMVGTQGVTLSQSVSGQSATLTIVGPGHGASVYASSNTTGAASSTTVDLRSLTFRGMGAVSIGASASEIIVSVPNTVAQTNQTIGGYFSSNTTAQSSSSTYDARSLTFRGVGGISVGASAGNEVILSVRGDYLTTAAASDHSHGNPTLALTNLSGTTASNSAGLTLSLSVAAPGAGGGIAAAAGTQTATSGTIVFANSNGVSWGMSDSSQITATVKTDYLTTAALSNHSHGNPQLNLTNLSGTTASASNGFTLSLSAAAQSVESQSIGIGTWDAGLDIGSSTAGTSGSASGGQVRYGFYPGSNVTLSQSLDGASASLTIHGPSPGVGAGVSISEWCPYPEMSLLTASSLVQNSLYFNPIDLQENVSAYRANFFASIGTTWNAAGNNTRSAGITLSFCLYSRGTGASSTRLESLLSRSCFINISGSSVSRVSATHPFGISNSTAVSTSQFGTNDANASTYLVNSVAGFRVINFPVSSALTPGRYWMAVANSTTSANASVALGISVVQQQHGSNIAAMPFGTSSKATNASWPQVFPGRGVYSATSGAFPATINMATDHIRQLATTVNLPFFNLSAYTTATNIL